MVLVNVRESLENIVAPPLDDLELGPADPLEVPGLMDGYCFKDPPFISSVIKTNSFFVLHTQESTYFTMFSCRIYFMLFTILMKCSV